MRFLMPLFTFLILGISSLLYVSNAAAQSDHERKVIRAEELLAEGALTEAVNLYEVALKNLIQRQNPSDRAEIGKIHSRLGQLYLKQMLKASSGDYALEFQALAARHYLQCVQIKELSDIIRERICAPKVEELLAPIRVIGEPYLLEVIHPSAFRGRVTNGQLLPRGLVSISSQKSTTSPPEQSLIRIPQEVPLDFTERSYMPERPLLKNAKGLVFRPVPNSPEYELYKNALGNDPSLGTKVPIAPGVLMSGLGISGIITGVVIQGLKLNVPMGAQGVKALYIAGGVFTTLGGAWLVWAW